MSTKPTGPKPTGRRRMNHAAQPLIDYVVGRATTRNEGPIPEFLAKKAAERAPKTYEWYHDSLMQLWAFLESHELTTVGQFDEHAVNRFRLHLRARGVSENTVSNRLRAIRAFGRWMAAKGWTERNQLADLQVPQSTKPHFDLIPDDIRVGLFGLFNPGTFLGSRNLAMLAVLSDTGLRREEVVNLLDKNVDLNARVIRVFSDKATEWRYVPLTDESVALLRNYLTWRARYFAQSSRPRRGGNQNHREHRPRQIRSDRIFLAWDGTALAPQSLMQILGRAGKKLGYRIHPHLFRHDWITRKALDGESPSVVRRWAGHKSFAMTDYYFSLAEEMLGAIQPKHSVLSNVPMPGAKRKRGRPASGAGG